MHKRQYVFGLYVDKKGLYRWTLRAPNGRILCDSGEGYESMSNARRALRRLKAILSQELDTTVEIHDPEGVIEIRKDGRWVSES